MSENKKYYVLLTGGKNNAGDFLIKTRAKSLLDHYRKDRAYHDLDGWKTFSADQIDLVNNAEALILTGGPSLQPGSRIESGIYPFIKALEKVKVPIYTFGVGYKGSKGTWGENSNYSFSELSMRLLQRVNQSGGKSSVRDYHTLDVLQKKGFKNFVMTGCPALYQQNKPLELKEKLEIRKIGFSLGVSYKLNSSMKQLMRSLITRVSKEFDQADLTIYFHHRINPEDRAQAEMLDYVKSLGISFKDISGGAEKLMEEYSDCDLHIGFRVHAHIFCSSIGTPSILLSEDGRAIALKEVLNGLVFRAHTVSSEGIPTKVLNRLKLIDRFKAEEGIENTLINTIKYESDNGCIRFNQAFQSILAHRNKMQEFIEQLP
ncbi:MAG: hypothetical protein COA32_04055 [Fluviicola sp.]|nr:MAG: hypothetical protein COA32_04055 [Fluviicola sp.]